VRPTICFSYISFAIQFSWKFRNRVVLLGPWLDRSVRSFARPVVLSTFEFHVYRFMDFTTPILIYGFNGLETFVVSLISSRHFHPMACVREASQVWIVVIPSLLT
jgi:hypothetical protein